ncbi:MAG: hypothetical protein JSV86_17100 [Gemmatimonadota bacterium]|nr:MAG: hypothetical protein JSV86_17100 [Gemmatimonadota bacterium]
MLTFTLGQGMEPTVIQPEEYLDHSLAPFRGTPRYLRLVSTNRHVLDYAAGGFHVSVARGLAGGCADPSAGFAAGGTRAGVCAEPLDRADLRTLWAKAAQAYLEIYNLALDGHPVDRNKALLLAANDLADRAYAAEGIDPPRDPMTGTSEPPRDKKGPRPRWGIALGILGIAGLGVYGIHRSRQIYGEYNP